MEELGGFFGRGDVYVGFGGRGFCGRACGYGWLRVRVLEAGELNFREGFIVRSVLRSRFLCREVRW